jgi:hypothetical protein
MRCIFLMVLAGVVSASAQPLAPAQADRYEELSARPLHQFSNADLAEYLQLRGLVYASSGSPDPADEIGKYALKGLGTPFRLHAGRFSLCEADCVSFVERTIALALANDWESYYLFCERLRHKSGTVDVLERNFFTLADWVPSNTGWLLRDVTRELDAPAVSFEYAVFRKRFLQNVRYGLGSEPTAITDHEVQLGAYPTQTEAQEKVNWCAQKGLSTVIDQQSRGQQVMWIVMLRYPTHDEAVAGLNQVRRIQPSAFLTESSKAAAKAAKIAEAPEKELLNAYMIDRNAIADALPALKTGDIALFVRTNSTPGLKPWFSCNHMGIVVVEPDGQIDLVSAMPAGASPGSVRRHPLRGMMGYTHSAGFIFLRLRSQITAVVTQEIDRMKVKTSVPDHATLDTNGPCGR